MYVVAYTANGHYWWVDHAEHGTPDFSKAKVFSSLTEAKAIAHSDEHVLTLEEAQAIMIAKDI